MKKLFQWFLVFLVFFFPYSAFSSKQLIKLKEIKTQKLANAVVLDLHFDQPFLAQNLKPVYERNFVQFVLNGISMDTAKMLGVSYPSHSLKKIFIYPYAPGVTRLRLILDKPGSVAKSQISYRNENTKLVRIYFQDSLGSPMSKLSGDLRPVNLEKRNEESQILKEVLTQTKEIDIHNPQSIKDALSATEKSPNPELLRPEHSRDVNATGSNAHVRDVNATGSNAKATQYSEVHEKPATKPVSPTPIGTSLNPTKHFVRMSIVLLGVISLFLVGVFLVRRYVLKFHKLPFGKKERLIQVIATHYLGNKKSISLVKVANEYMVVGVSNEGINLISKCGVDLNVEKYLEDRFWGGTFEKHLDSFTKPAAQDAQPEMISSISRSPVAANMVEGKERSSVKTIIKERVMNLKPLV